MTCMTSFGTSLFEDIVCMIYDLYFLFILD